MKNAIQAIEKILIVIQEMGYDADEARDLLSIAHNFLTLEKRFHQADPMTTPANLLKAVEKRSKPHKKEQ